MLKKEIEVKEEYQQKIDEFLDLIDSHMSSKSDLNIKDIISVFFEYLHKFNREMPEQYQYQLINECSTDKFLNLDLEKLELIKLSFILSRMKIPKEIIEKCFKNLTCKILKLELQDLSKEEISTIIANFSYNSVYPDIELFTRLEPYILKYLENYSVFSIINLFSSYLKNLCGTDVFLNTLGFSISKNLEFCKKQDLIHICLLSGPKFFHREELSLNFIDLFPQLYYFISKSEIINSLKEKEIYIILHSIANVKYPDKKLIHLMSTIYLKYAEKTDLKFFVRTLYLFALLDLDNEIFWQKSIDVLRLDVMCLKNFIFQINNLEGLYEKSFIDKLNRIYTKNTKSLTQKLSQISTMTEEDVYQTMEFYAKLLFTLSYYSNKYKNNEKMISALEELTKDSIEIYNSFIFNMQKLNNENENYKINIFSHNVEIILLSYLSLNTLKKIKTNINIEIFSQNSDFVNIMPGDSYYKGFETFLQFKNIVEKIISSQEDIKILESSNSSSSISIENLANFQRTIEDKKGQQLSQLIFINEPYETTNNLISGKIKLRRSLCKENNYSFLEIDYNEFLVYHLDTQILESTLDNLVEEFLQIKLNKDIY